MNGISKLRAASINPCLSLLLLGLGLHAATASAADAPYHSLAGGQPVRMQPDSRWKQHDMSRPKPTTVQPATPSTQEKPGRPPSDAVVLFDGREISQWASMEGESAKWIVRDGYMESVKGSGYIRTWRNFGDCQLHVEWASPLKVEGEGQGRGNSGIFFMTKYEVQVLDCYQNETYADGYTAAAYGQYPPTANACLPPGHWQTYDIIFMRPRFDKEGKTVSPARVTVLHNGVLVQNAVEMTGPSDWLQRPPYETHPDKLPIALQDHGNPVRYRNIWLREIGDAGKAEYTYSTNLLARYAGTYEVRPDFSIRVELRNAQLFAFVKIPRRESLHPLFAESPTRFFMKEVDGYIDFPAAADAPVNQATFHIGIEDHVGKRVGTP